MTWGLAHEPAPDAAALGVIRYCECGGALTLRGERNPRTRETIRAAFDTEHDGAGHERITAGQARDIRAGRKRRGDA